MISISIPSETAGIKVFVLDEADEMLSRGFKDQIYDVFTDKAITLKDSTAFVVSVNPTGVVMWYVSAPGKLKLRQFYEGGRRQGSAYNDENTIPRVFF